MEETIELSQKEKLKKFNQKLALMMKNKNIHKTKLTSLPVNSTIKKQQQSQAVLNGTERQSQSQKNRAQIQQKQDKKQQSESSVAQNEVQKTKKIKKGPKDAYKKQKNVTLRKAAGQVWKDKSLQEWPDNDYRIFVGNLGNQVTDQMLSQVFRNKYSSFQMAKVVLDKRTGKSRGYGFVSIKEPKDFLNALKQMNNKYIGNRPVKLTKSSWKDRALESDKNKQLPSDFKAISGKQTNKVCPNFKYVSPF